MKHIVFITHLVLASIIFASPSFAQKLQITGPKLTDELSIEALKQQFGNHEIRTISTWSKGKKIVYQGVSLDQVLSKFGIDSVKIEVLAENGYSSEIPRSMVSTYQPILALEGDGVPLDFSTRGPIALIWPRSEFPAELGETTDGMWTWYVNAIRPID